MTHKQTTVDVSKMTRSSVAGTRTYCPEELEELAANVPSSPENGPVPPCCSISVTEETVLQCAYRVRSECSSVET